MKWQLLSDLDLGVWDEDAAHSYPPEGRGIPNIAGTQTSLPGAGTVHVHESNSSSSNTKNPDLFSSEYNS